MRDRRARGAASASSAAACSAPASGTRSARRGVDVVARRRLALAAAPRDRLRRRSRAGAPMTHPSLIVVAVPPDVTADVVAARAGARTPTPSSPTSRASSSSRCDDLRARGADLTPLHRLAPAGRPRARRRDLRPRRPLRRPPLGRRRHDGSPTAGAAAGRGARPRPRRDADRDDADEHDRASRSSRTCRSWWRACWPAGSSTRRRAALGLAGPGPARHDPHRRIDPELWVQILGANAEPVVEVLAPLRDDLDAVLGGARDPDAPGSRRAVADTIRRGNDGRRAPPGQARPEPPLRARRRDGRRHARPARPPVRRDRRARRQRRRPAPRALPGSPVRARRDQRRARGRRVALVDGLEARGWKIASTTNDEPDEHAAVGRRRSTDPPAAASRACPRQVARPRLRLPRHRRRLPRAGLARARARRRHRGRRRRSLDVARRLRLRDLARPRATTGCASATPT